MEIDGTRYNKTRALTAEGKIRNSSGNGDAIFMALLGMSTAELVEVANGNLLGIKPEDYSNSGQFRMAVGNKLRGRFDKQTRELRDDSKPVVVNGAEITSLDQEVKTDRQAPIVGRPAKGTTDGQEAEEATSTRRGRKRATRGAPAAEKAAPAKTGRRRKGR